MKRATKVFLAAALAINVAMGMSTAMRTRDELASMNGFRTDKTPLTDAFLAVGLSPVTNLPDWDRAAVLDSQDAGHHSYRMTPNEWLAEKSARGVLQESDPNTVREVNLTRGMTLNMIAIPGNLIGGIAGYLDYLANKPS